MQANHSHGCEDFLTRRKANHSHLQIFFPAIVSTGVLDIIVPGSKAFQLLVNHISRGVVLQKYKDISSKHGCSDHDQKSDTVMVSLSRKTLCAARVALQRSHIPRIGKRRIIIPRNEISSIAQFAPEGLLNNLRT